MSPRKVRGWALVAVLLVAGVAAVASYAHQQELALAHGEDWRSYLLPLSVDGMLLATTLAIVDRRRRREPAGWVPWFGLALGIVASLAANIAAARPDLVSQLIAAWPPLALAIAIETLVVVLRRPKTPAASAAEPPTEPAIPLGPAPEPPTPVATPAPPPRPRPAVEVEAIPAARVAALVADGATDRRIAAALSITRYQAQKLIAAHSSNGNGGPRP